MPIITVEQAYERLKTVKDPELGIDLVSLGLIYDVTVVEVQEKSPAKSPAETPVKSQQNSTRTKVHILMTLTTPGCPLAGVFDTLVKDAFFGLEGLDPNQDITVELTFDPPWFQDMMSEEAKAELGF